MVWIWRNDFSHTSGASAKYNRKLMGLMYQESKACLDILTWYFLKLKIYSKEIIYSLSSNSSSF